MINVLNEKVHESRNLFMNQVLDQGMMRMLLGSNEHCVCSKSGPGSCHSLIHKRAYLCLERADRARAILLHVGVTSVD